MAEEPGLPDQAEPGWYPDPSKPDLERLWDGSQWVDWVRPAGEASDDDSPGWRPDPSDAHRERLWTGVESTPYTRAGNETPPKDQVESGQDDAPRAQAKMQYVDPTKPKPLNIFGWIAVISLSLTILSNLYTISTDQRYIKYAEDLIGGTNPGLPQVESAIDDLEVASAAYVITFVIAAIAFICWFYRAYRNLPRRGITDLRYGPGWAIGAWFVPILGLFRPKQIANDIWRGSTTISQVELPAWGKRPVPSLLGCWWGCWVIGSVLGYIGTRVTANAGSALSATKHVLEQERTGLYVDQVASVLLIAAAVLAIFVVRRISTMQDGNIASAAPAAEEKGEVKIAPQVVQIDSEEIGAETHPTGHAGPEDRGQVDPMVGSPAPSPPDLAASDIKICPECAEEIKSAAKKCRYCGYRFA